ncbi:response regulator [Acidobacteriota bacterium]
MFKRVLVVDDDRDILFGLKELLQSASIDITTADSREKAEALLQSAFYDVVIADLMLSSSSPEDGLKLVHYIKAHHTDTRTIVITGCGESDIKNRAHEAGATLVFVKPVPGAVLQRVVNTT